MFTEFHIYIKTDDIYKDITEHVETRINTNYKLDKPLPKRIIKNNQIIER